MDKDYPVDEQEIIEFLNGVDKGIAGLTKPQVRYIKEPTEYPDQDNWAGSPEQAWA